MQYWVSEKMLWYREREREECEMWEMRGGGGPQLAVQEVLPCTECEHLTTPPTTDNTVSTLLTIIFKTSIQISGPSLLLSSPSSGKWSLCWLGKRVAEGLGLVLVLVVGWEADELQQAGLSAVIDTSTLWSQQAGIHDNSILSGIFLSSLPPLPVLGIKPYRRQILEEWSGLGKPFKGVSEALNTNPMNGSNTDWYLLVMFSAFWSGPTWILNLHFMIWKSHPTQKLLLPFIL